MTKKFARGLMYNHCNLCKLRKAIKYFDYYSYYLHDNRYEIEEQLKAIVRGLTD